jgi:hypothetical protein
MAAAGKALKGPFKSLNMHVIALYLLLQLVVIVTRYMLCD